jgi:hypothetical protein
MIISKGCLIEAALLLSIIPEDGRKKSTKNKYI